MAVADTPKVAVTYRSSGTLSVQRDIFVPLATQLTHDLKEYLDEDILEGEPGPPQRDGGPKGPQNQLATAAFLTVVAFIGVSFSSWTLKKVWDVFLGEPFERFLLSAKDLLGDIVGREHDKRPVEMGFYKKDREGVTLSLAMWSPRDGKYAVIRIDADEPGGLDRAKPLLAPAIAALQAEMNIGNGKPCLLYRITNGKPAERILHLDEVPYEGDTLEEK